MMPVIQNAVIQNAQSLAKTTHAVTGRHPQRMPARVQPALRPVGLRETALVAVLAAALGLATAVLLPPDLVPASEVATQKSDRGR